MKATFFPVVLSLFAIAAFGQQKPVYTDSQAGSHSGEEASVKGKVVSVSTTSKGTTYLNFGDRFPRQTFSGVIFSRNEAAVGDVKQFEGKDVTITGRIELSPDQKPQMILKSADQIKLSDSAPAPTPAPVATAPTPTPTPAPAMPVSVPATPTPAVPATTPAAPAPVPAPLPYTKPSRSFSGKIALATNWPTTAQGAEMTRKDLAKLFGSSGTASENVEVDTSMEIYPGIMMLTPLVEAKKTLRLDGLPTSKSRILTPGLPPGSLNVSAFTGIFPGGYSQLFLITDNADQVVSVMLLDATPRVQTPNEADTTGYHTLNFITGKVKASSDLVIRHSLATDDAPPGVVLVDSLLVDPTNGERRSKSKSAGSSLPKNGKVLERSRWFVPEPLVNVILRCAGGKQ